MFVTPCATRVAVRGQLGAADFLCLLYGSQGLNSDYKAGSQITGLCYYLKLTEKTF